MLSARGDEKDKVTCLELGADDYLTKPFSIKELMSRIKAVLRRTEAIGTTPTQSSFTAGALEINFAQRRVTVTGKEVKLTPTEFSLLQELVLNAGKVLTHTHLLNKVWGMEYREEREYLRVFIRRLRAKLGRDPTAPQHIINVPAVGYKFEDKA
jgi:two-component system KDP operon response regulator KdpE